MLLFFVVENFFERPHAILIIYPDAENILINNIRISNGYVVN